MHMYKNTHHLVYYLYQIAFINFRDIFYSSFYAFSDHEYCYTPPIKITL